MVSPLIYFGSIDSATRRHHARGQRPHKTGHTFYANPAARLGGSFAL
jgi:hypothetical protein